MYLAFLTKYVCIRKQAAERANDSLVAASIRTEDIPYFMVDWISSMRNVRADGNCGFRAYAVGLEMNEEEWPYIRRRCLDELQSRPDHYRKLFGLESDYDELATSLHWFNGSCVEDTSKWMMMPLAGYVLANAFERPLYYFSPHECFTFLPDACPLNRNPGIAIALLGSRSHFVSVNLKPGSPVPKIAHGWKRYASASSMIWQQLVSSKVIMYEGLREPSKPKLTEEEIHAATIIIEP